MPISTPGGSIRLMYGGNGHSRGYNAGPNNDPGRVAVYWAGAPEIELTDRANLTSDYLVQEQGFSEEAFMYPDDKGIVSPEQGLVDKGNWMTLKL
ncbi:hypothetical protein BKA63DRAFT_426576 [Paraphoma chrysanthemicola]|nr:hypothetical protein BKA63DRAFT_426576 [Paraphoma chrysanthemicola]